MTTGEKDDDEERRKSTMTAKVKKEKRKNVSPALFSPCDADKKTREEDAHPQEKLLRS